MDNLPERLAIADAPSGESGPAEGGTIRRHSPKRPGGRANVLRWARRGPWSIGASWHEENQGLAEQHSNEKIWD